MIKDTSDGLILTLRILPNSSCNSIIIENDVIKVKVTAQPIEGQANKALIKFLSKELDVPKSKIEILKGEASKDKSVIIRNITDDVKLKITAKLTK